VNALERVLDRESTVYAACGAALAIGLSFIFIRAPHPWGIEGFDHYHELALAVASGRPFPTMDVPWGYAYFLAAFYRVFGDHPSIPLTAQAVLNALVPLLVYKLARHWVARRTAILAALLTGLLSFNTVYASTQSSDAVCTVIFLAAILACVRGLTSGARRWYVLSGLLAGLAPQFRPNLILVPLLLAGYAMATARRGRRPMGTVLILPACAALALMPWVVRNYRLTRMLIPASVHSGVQLWYGTLQVGPYLNSRAYNPRAAFEFGVFNYTSLDQVPLVITARHPGCRSPAPTRTALEYWTSRDPLRRTIQAVRDGDTFRFEAPAPAAPAVFYYYLSATRPEAAAETVPDEGPSSPYIFFISQDHLGDLDIAGDLLDVFDLVRVMRRMAWNEPLRWAERLRDAGFDGTSAEPMVRALVRRFGQSVQYKGPAVRDFRHDEHEAILTLADESTISVPRVWRERITDVAFSGGLAAALIPSTVPLRASATTPRLATPACVGLDDVEINRVFYRLEPHLLRRYTALALDNIERAPIQFALAAIFRVGRLFVVWGTADAATTQQFSGGRFVTSMATVASVGFVSLFLFGAAAAWRHGDAVVLPLLLVAYVPVTIAPMLTNMRYTVTVQPLMFVFVAAALMAIVERAAPKAARRAERDRASTRTAPLP
jgi:hypothetical protein